MKTLKPADIHAIGTILATDRKGTPKEISDTLANLIVHSLGKEDAEEFITELIICLSLCLRNDLEMFDNLSQEFKHNLRQVCGGL